MSTLQPGVSLSPRYVLRERIAVGGMSEVWRAEDTLLSRPVAVKILAAELAGDPARRAGVHREARATAKLNHPRITRMYDYGETTLPGGCRAAYLVMEFVAGRTLAAKLAAGPLPWQEAVQVAGQVATALAAAHRAGLVHRDVKPGNIMLTEAGAKILDFGIAALVSAANDAIDGNGWGYAAGIDEPTVELAADLFAFRPSTGGTAADHPDHPGPVPAAGPGPAAVGLLSPDDAAAAAPLIGTPAYAAPEWIAGTRPTPAADVYGLGALLYETLTGRPPVRARTWQEAARTHTAGIRPPTPEAPGLPAGVANLCLACLSLDPADRPTAAEVATALGERSLDPRRPYGAIGTHRHPMERPPGLHRPVPVTRTVSAQVGSGRSARSRTRPRPAVVALLTSAAALVLTLGLAVTAVLDRDPGQRSATAAPPARTEPPATAAPPAPSPPAGTSRRVPAPPEPTRRPPAPERTRDDLPAIRAAATATTFERVLDDAAADGQIRDDVVVDLRNLVTHLRDRIEQGRPARELRDSAKALRLKIAERRAENSIDAAAAAELDAALDPMLG